MGEIMIDELKGAPPTAIAIHGVGNHPKGHVEKRVRESPASVGIEVDEEEFNWDSITPHFSQSTQAFEGFPDFLRQASKNILTATNLGFASGADRYLLPVILRWTDSICFPVVAKALSLACMIALLLPACTLFTGFVFFLMLISRT